MCKAIVLFIKSLYGVDFVVAVVLDEVPLTTRYSPLTIRTSLSSKEANKDSVTSIVLRKNFRDTFILRFFGAHTVSQYLNSAILRQFYILNHFNFVFLSTTQPVSLVMLLWHVLEFSKGTITSKLTKTQRQDCI